MGAEFSANGRWIGQSIRPVEFRRHVTGTGSFVDDLQRPGLRYLAFARSQHPAARIASLDTEDARAVAGVEAVLTAADLDDLAPLMPALARDEFVAVEMPLLARERVRFAGEPVAMVVARTPHAAEDGAEQVRVDYEEGDAVASLEAALADDAPLRPRRRARQPAARRAVRRRRRRARLRAGGGGRGGELPHRPRDGRADGGPRLPGGVGPPRGPGAALHLDAGPAHRAHRGRRDPRPARAAPARGRARRRRRLRPEVRGRARGGADARRRARGRPSGEVDRGPPGEPARRLPGPRPALRRAGGVRRRRADPGARRRHPLRRRRLLQPPVHLRRRAADGGHRAVRRLPRRALPRADPGGRDQQEPDGALPRRVAAADRARDGAAAAEGRPRARPRSRRDPPPQPDPRRRLPQHLAGGPRDRPRLLPRVARPLRGAASATTSSASASAAPATRAACSASASAASPSAPATAARRSPSAR